MIVQQSIGFGTIVVDGGDLYWIETRPLEGGRHVIVNRSTDGKVVDVTPTGFNARTRVHEYGGGAYTAYTGTIYFSNFADQRLYRQDPGLEPTPLTIEGLRFAEPVFDQKRNRLIAVCEDHRLSGRALNSVAAIDISTGSVTTLLSGFDFYSFPKLNHDQTRLACTAWNLPQMPWDGTELLLASLLENGSVEKTEKIAGGLTESIFQPEWAPNGDLYFVSDRSDWWNLYSYRDGNIEAVCPNESEFGRPQWHLGYSQYAFESRHSIIATYNVGGFWRIGRIDLSSKTVEEFLLPFTDISWLKTIGDSRAIFRGGSPTAPQAIVELDLQSLQWKLVKPSIANQVDEKYISIPEQITFKTSNNMSAYGLYYPPKNTEFTLGANPLVLLVKCHGGPTGCVSSLLNLEYQFFTSRGIAIVDVNYGGSSGYGRAYRERLKGQWGIVDVEDCVAAAAHLAKTGKADDSRIVISGGSAGGFTTLCALTFSDKFRAGASYYGIGDLEALELDTHKFESRYSSGLVAPYPEQRDIYIARSPLYHVDKLLRAVCLFQGLEDKVVPPNQAEKMVEALRKNHVPFAYIPFEHEQHGFRRAESIRRCLDAELYFYSRILGFELADHIEPVEIENLVQLV
jgi:dienelactone hydrolase